MKKSSSRFIRRGFGMLLLIFGGLGLIIMINTIRFSSRQIQVDAVEKIKVPEGAIERLSQAIQIPTISYPDRIDTIAFVQLDTLIKSSFPLIDSLLDQLSVASYSKVFHWPGREVEAKPVLLLAHLDVVPVEEATQQLWTESPFSGKIKDGYIWGRGALDDKVSAFSILEAVEQLLAEGRHPNRSIYLAFGHDEEVSGFEGAKTIADFFAEQNIHFEFVLDEGQIILENALPGLEAPLAMIGLAEKGYVTLDLEVRLNEGGHSSMPPPETAIGILSSSIHQLQKHPFPARIDGATKGLFEYVGPEMQLLYKTLFANLWLTEPLLTKLLSGDNASKAIISTTMAPTLIQGGVRANVLPTQAQAKVNFRILPGETVETVIAYVKQTIDDNRVQVKPAEDSGLQNPSFVSPADAPGFRLIQKSIQQVFPEVVVAPALVIGATDSRHFQQVSDHIYRFLPVYLTKNDLSRFHGIDERIKEESYEDVIRFYRQLLLNCSN